VRYGVQHASQVVRAGAVGEDSVSGAPTEARYGTGRTFAPQPPRSGWHRTVPPGSQGQATLVPQSGHIGSSEGRGSDASRLSRSLGVTTTTVHVEDDDPLASTESIVLVTDASIVDPRTAEQLIGEPIRCAELVTATTPIQNVVPLPGPQPIGSSLPEDRIVPGGAEDGIVLARTDHDVRAARLRDAAEHAHDHHSRGEY
jgi:hypothetical protein